MIRLSKYSRNTDLFKFCRDKKYNAQYRHGWFIFQASYKEDDQLIATFFTTGLRIDQYCETRALFIRMINQANPDKKHEHVVSLVELQHASFDLFDEVVKEIARSLI